MRLRIVHCGILGRTSEGRMRPVLQGRLWPRNHIKHPDLGDSMDRTVSYTVFKVMQHKNLIKRALN